MKIPELNLERRLWSRLKQNGDCWDWQGSHTAGGYPKFMVNGRYTYVYRFVYELLRDEIPANLTIDHLCRNKSCCNPWHLEPVTNRVNVQRGRVHDPVLTHCKRGHEFTPANTYIARNPYGRVCRACRAAAARAKKQGLLAGAA